VQRRRSPTKEAPLLLHATLSPPLVRLPAVASLARDPEGNEDGPVLASLTRRLRNALRAAVDNFLAFGREDLKTMLAGELDVQRQYGAEGVDSPDDSLFTLASIAAGWCLSALRGDVLALPRAGAGS
jgi:hypothetical protein